MFPALGSCTCRDHRLGGGRGTLFSRGAGRAHRRGYRARRHQNAAADHPYQGQERFFARRSRSGPRSPTNACASSASRWRSSSRRPSTSRRMPPSGSRSSTRICRSWSTPREALRRRRRRVHEEMPDNLASNTSTATAQAAEQAFAKARRMSSASASARSASPAIRWSRSPALARYDAATDSFRSLLPDPGHLGHQGGARHDHRRSTPRKFRVHSNDVGGGFGVRNEIYPEFLAVLLAAKRTGKPVRWTGTRSETIVRRSSRAARADLKGELALDDKGKFLGAARRMAGQHRRLLLGRRRADQHRRGADQLGHQPLQGAGVLRPAPPGVHQHDADHRLSRRGPAQRRVSVGAPGRGGGAPRSASIRSGCAGATFSPRPRSR